MQNQQGGDKQRVECFYDNTRPTKPPDMSSLYEPGRSIFTPFSTSTPHEAGLLRMNNNSGFLNSQTYPTTPKSRHISNEHHQVSLLCKGEH